MNKKIIFTMLLMMLLVGQALAGEDARLYAMAREAAKSGNLDFAFMRYRTIALVYPKSIYRPLALFAQGEYYFDQNNDQESAGAFKELIERYPGSDARMFALVHLFKMAQRKGDTALAESLTRDIINLKQVSLIFRDFKEYEYRSPLYRKYKAVFHIDTIEFFREGQLFAKISF